MDSSWKAARGLWKRAPSPRVLILKTEDGTVAVPASRLASEKSRHDGSAGDVAGGLIAGVLLGAIIGGIAAAAAIASAFSHALI